MRVPAGPGGEFRLNFKPELSNVLLRSENAGACLGAAGSNERAAAGGPMTGAKQVAPGPSLRLIAEGWDSCQGPTVVQY